MFTVDDWLIIYFNLYPQQKQLPLIILDVPPRVCGRWSFRFNYWSVRGKFTHTAVSRPLILVSGNPFGYHHLNLINQIMRAITHGFVLRTLLGFLCRKSVPETWAEFSNNNIKRSQAERANSKAVRVEIADTINRCANEMWNQWNKVGSLWPHPSSHPDSPVYTL